MLKVRDPLRKIQGTDSNILGYHKNNKVLLGQDVYPTPRKATEIAIMQ